MVSTSAGNPASSKRSVRLCASAWIAADGLPIEQAGGRPPQEHRQRRRAGCEQQGVDRGEANAGRTQQAARGRARRCFSPSPCGRGLGEGAGGAAGPLPRTPSRKGRGRLRRCRALHAVSARSM